MTQEGFASKIECVSRKFYNDMLVCHDEIRKLFKILDLIPCRGVLKVLDVGCGYGRILKLLNNDKYEVTGVEINKKIVEVNRLAGFQCYDLDEFKENKTVYDIIIMFHIIEHFSPGPLLEIMDFYLDRLKPGGHLIIATPLMTKYFYEDFDHVRPYDPAGIEMVFGTSSGQVQYYSRNKIKLMELVYKKYPFRFAQMRGLYIKSPGSYMIRLAHFISGCIFLLTCGIIGKKDGWIGLYRKL